MKKRIFTFWEPRKNMPPYLQLCMETWRKYLSAYEIVLLDFDNLSDYLPQELINKIVYRGISLAPQSDCIRAALLNRHGGIWLDADTIITGTQFLDWIEDCDVALVGKERIFGAFIYAARPKTEVISRWESAVIERVSEYKKSTSWIHRRFFREQYKKVRSWDYFENAILDPMVKEYPDRLFRVIDRDIAGALPERNPLFKKHETDNLASAYCDFWFSHNPDIDTNAILDSVAGGIIMLHNSWTPEKYRSMSVQELKQEKILLTRVLDRVLNK